VAAVVVDELRRIVLRKPRMADLAVVVREQLMALQVYQAQAVLVSQDKDTTEEMVRQARQDPLRVMVAVAVAQVQPEVMQVASLLQTVFQEPVELEFFRIYLVSKYITALVVAVDVGALVV
jgi:hypothetical protein